MVLDLDINEAILNCLPTDTAHLKMNKDCHPHPEVNVILFSFASLNFF